MNDRVASELDWFAFVGRLRDAVDQTNEEIWGAKMSNVTGATYLAGQFKTLIADVKKQLDDAGAQLGPAIAELQDVAVQAVNHVKAVKSETAELKAALGLTSNNPPEVSPPVPGLNEAGVKP